MRSLIFVLFLAFAFVFVAAAPVEQQQVRRYYADESINSVSFEKREDDFEVDADVAKRGLLDFFASAGSTVSTNFLNLFKSYFNWGGSVSAGSGSTSTSTGTTTTTTTATTTDDCDDDEDTPVPQSTITAVTCPHWWSCL
ncbi:hypothetical protein CLIB1423_26S00232 [[Candida] railenensis]|uniref:Uncharacterized protein n=1 Tax=[Candida] railenensis TaxID=45579 RepID=A0A9P0W0V8_9ASCO|nr:hypothetical protein CLIB1423_26S00232 [[Candida] railenensis]